MNDAVLAIALSPNGKHVAVALADGTVKVRDYPLFTETKY